MPYLHLYVHKSRKKFVKSVLQDTQFLLPDFMREEKVPVAIHVVDDDPDNGLGALIVVDMTGYTARAGIGVPGNATALADSGSLDYNVTDDCFYGLLNIETVQMLAALDAAAPATYIDKTFEIELRGGGEEITVQADCRVRNEVLLSANEPPVDVLLGSNDPIFPTLTVESPLVIGDPYQAQNATGTASVVVAGVPGFRYGIRIRVAGTVENKDYTGGLNESHTPYFQIGGAPVASNANIYKLEVSSPPQTFYLNKLAGATTGMVLNYITHILADAGATLTLSYDTVDGLQLGDQSLSITDTGSFIYLLAPHHLSHENGGTDEIDVTGLSGLLADAQTPLAHTHPASDISDSTAAGRAVLTAASAAAQRTALGLVIGTDVQAYDAELAALAGLVSAADKLPYFTGSGAASLADLTAFARTFLDDADAGAVLATLGAAPLASPTFTGVPAGPTAAGGTSTTQLATTAFVSAAVSAAVSGLLEMKGNLDCSANPNYPAGSVGDTYYVTVAGKIGGASGKSVDVGDAVVCKTDNAGGDEAAVGTSWFVMEHNLAGALLSANNLSDVANAATARTNLGLAIGVDVAAQSSLASYLPLAGGTMAGAITLPNGARITGAALSGSQVLKTESTNGYDGILLTNGNLAAYGISSHYGAAGFNFGSQVQLGWSSSGHGNAVDTALLLDAAGVLAQRAGTTAQTHRVYRTWMDPSNNEYFQTTWSGTTCYLQTQKAGTGTLRDLAVRCDTFVALRTVNASTQLFLLNDLFQLDNGDGARIFGVQTLQNNSAPIHIRSAGGDGLQVLHGGGVTIDNSTSPDTVATLTLNARGTQLAPLLYAAATTISGDGTFKVASGKLLQFGGTSASETAWKRSSAEIQARLADDSAFCDVQVSKLTINTAAQMMKSAVSMTDGAGASAGTLLNAPSAGDPTKWIAFDDNGTTRYIPAW